LPVVIDILENDSDPDTEDLDVTLGDPSNGSVALEDGDYVYTPDANFNGSDSFFYTIFDGETTASASVNITINAVNDAPVATDGTAATDEDMSVTVDVAALASDIDSGSLTFTLGTDASDGGVVNNGDGTFTYTPDADYNGGDSFTYAVSDGELSASGSVAITVVPVNDAPVAMDDAMDTAFETPVTIDVLDNDSDAAGGVTYTPADGFSGSGTIDVTISDGTVDVSSEIAVTVGEADNRAPVAMDDAAEVAEDGTVYISILGNDEDPDGDALTVVLGDPSNGMVEFDGEGYRYTPDANFNGDDSFTYTISDGALEEAVNDAPVLAALAAMSVSEDDAALAVDVLDGASDVDGDMLSVSSVSASWAGGALGVTQTEDGFTFDPSQLGADLNTGDTGVVTVDYAVSDGTATVMASAIINVTGADEAVSGPIMVEGTDGSDLLRGTDEDEIITSGAGRYDRMFGGGGEDIFVFGDETSNGVRERNIIYDFDVAEDTICLADDDFSLRVLGTTGVIKAGEDLIYVRGSGITLDELEASIDIGCIFEIA